MFSNLSSPNGNPINREILNNLFDFSLNLLVSFLFPYVSNRFFLAQLLTVCVRPLNQRVDVPTPERTSTSTENYDSALPTRQSALHGGIEAIWHSGKARSHIVSYTLFNFLSLLAFYDVVFLLSLSTRLNRFNEFCVDIAAVTEK